MAKGNKKHKKYVAFVSKRLTSLIRVKFLQRTYRIELFTTFAFIQINTRLLTIAFFCHQIQHKEKHQGDAGWTDRSKYNSLRGRTTLDPLDTHGVSSLEARIFFEVMCTKTRNVLHLLSHEDKHAMSNE
jgi:hypothetical protein